MTFDKLLSTSEVAYFLNIKRQQVVYYIQAGYLNAVKKGKRYFISQKNLNIFKESYFFKNRNFKNRGVKTLTIEAYNLLKDVIPALEDDSVSYNDFIQKFKDIYILPHSDLYLKFKRDNCIKTDKLKGLSVKDIAKKYALSEIRVYEILKEEVEYIN